MTSHLMPFQYMLLLRGATISFTVNSCSNLVSIHAPLARSNSNCVNLLIRAMVSIHAPLARSNFRLDFFGIFVVVSIHAPLARSNCHRRGGDGSERCFNTCSSCEEQRRPEKRRRKDESFQYMLLLRGATSGGWIGAQRHYGFNTCSSCEEQRL